MGVKNSKLKEMNFETYVADFSHLNAFLPDEQDPPTMISSIQKMGLENSLTIEDLKIDFRSRVTEATDFQIITLGNLENIQKLLDSLPVSKRLLIPRRLYLVATDEGKSRAVIDLSAPFQPPPKDLGEVESQIREYNPREKELIEKIKTYRDYTSK